MYQKPDIVIFDYGQTLLDEGNFEPMKGDQELLTIAVKNPNRVTARQVQDLADAMSADIGEALCSKDRNGQGLEVSIYPFNRYLYEYLEVELPKEDDPEWIFWSHSVQAKPTKNIEKFLEYLYQAGIRTGVASNMMNSSRLLKKQIDEKLPGHHFEFIIASGDYVFRKPHKRFFDMVLKKAKAPADKIWFCGDNRICDILGSYQAGMNPVWYTGAEKEGRIPQNPDVPHVQIEDWEELISMLDILRKPENLLFQVDSKEYPIDGEVFQRAAVRGLIRRGDTYALIHSAKYGEYKFPGGGMDAAEQLHETLIREVAEETGLKVKPESVRYLGRVEERRKGLYNNILEMTSHYCFCEAEEGGMPSMDEYEKEYGYQLEFVSLEQAINHNESIADTKEIPWIFRDTKMMKWLAASKALQ